MMVGLVEISAALTALKTGAETLKTSYEAYSSLTKSGGDKDLAAVQQVAAQLAEDLYKARMGNLEAQNSLLELKQKLDSEDKFETTRAKYTIAKSRAGGDYLKLTDPNEVGKLHENVCPNCTTKFHAFMPIQPYGKGVKCYNCQNVVPWEV